MMELLKRLFGRGNKENSEAVVTNSKITELEFEEVKKDDEDDNDNLKKEIEILKDKLIKADHEAVELQNQLVFSIMEIDELQVYNYNCEEEIKELREENRYISLDASMLEDVVEDLIRDMNNNKTK